MTVEYLDLGDYLAVAAAVTGLNVPTLMHVTRLSWVHAEITEAPVKGDDESVLGGGRPRYRGVICAEQTLVGNGLDVVIARREHLDQPDVEVHVDRMWTDRPERTYRRWMCRRSTGNAPKRVLRRILSLCRSLSNHRSRAT